MQEQSNDISGMFQSLLDELQSMRQTIDSQHAMICQLNRNSESQLHEIRSLRKDNLALRERLSKYEQPPKNSNNSSISPAKEPIKSEVKRRTKSLRKKSDKPVGGQKGHEGFTRERTESVDEIVDHTSNYCSCCGHDITAIEPTLMTGDTRTLEFTLKIG